MRGQSSPGRPKRVPLRSLSGPSQVPLGFVEPASGVARAWHLAPPPPLHPIRPVFNNSSINKAVRDRVIGRGEDATETTAAKSASR